MTFHWQVAVTLAAGCIMLAIACVAQTQRKILVANPFSASCLLAGVWCFIYAWHLQSTSLEEKLFLIQLGFTTVPVLPLLSLETTYRFVHERRLFRGWLLPAALIVPVLTAILAWTINESTIFRYDCWVDMSGPLPLLRFKSGPWDALFHLYCYGLAIWSFVILLASLRSATPWARRTRLLFIFARLIPIAFQILFNFSVLPPAGMNYAPASIALSAIIISIIFFGDRLGYQAYIAHSALVEKINDLLIVLDGKRRVLDINHATAQALGFRLEAIQGKPVEVLFDSWKEVLEHLQEGTEPVEVERDGKCFELSIIPVEDNKKASGSVILWLRNITRRKQAELAHMEAAASAREANRAKDRYLAVMSHEIRSPLNSVLGFMRLLEHTALNSEQREYVGHISRSGDNLLGVINEVLDFAKIEAGHMSLVPAPFDFREEMTNLCSGMRLEAETKGLHFHCNIAQDVPEILIGDNLRVCQILRNLIANAIKFTANGSVAVHVDGIQESGDPRGCQLRLTVSDTGIGISAPEMQVLFQPFSQATPSIHHQYGGTGLGLLIARRFSELMGGTITVESIPGHGSTFTCLLRLGVGDSLVTCEPDELSSGATPPLRILIVDDQPTNCRLLQIMLVRMNHKTEAVSNGYDCLAVLEERNFDVVLMDIEMPGIDGFEVTRKIRHKSKEHAFAFAPRIIALTAHASTNIREQCFAAGMDGYLSKPVTLSALKEALETVGVK